MQKLITQKLKNIMQIKEEKAENEKEKVENEKVEKENEKPENDLEENLIKEFILNIKRIYKSSYYYYYLPFFLFIADINAE